MDLERHPEYLRRMQILLLTWISASLHPGQLWIGLKAAVFLVLLTAHAAAAEAEGEPESSRSEAQTIVVSREDCRVLAAYTEQGSADYKPGVDANGRPVVGANLADPAPSVVPDEITFTLTVRLADFVPGLTDSLADSAAPIGEITVRGGEVFLNGRSLNEAQSNTLAVACRDILAGERER